MAATPDKVIAIAKAEIGYLEKSIRAYRQNPAIVYEKVLGAGYDNITKYGKEMHEVYPQTMDFPAMWCFTEGTMILTDAGYKAVEDIQVGDRVLNAYGETFNTVTDTAQRSKNVRQLKAYSSLPLFTTDDHPFLSNQRMGVRKDWKYTPLDFYPAEALRHGDNVVIPKTIFKNELDLSYDEAWVVGYFVGDGWKSSNGEYKLCGCAKKEIELYKHITAIRKDPDYKSRTCFEYAIHKAENSRILPLLDEAGKGAGNKVVPASLFFARTDVKKAFLDGYLTADGTKDGKFNTVSKKLALGISKLAVDIGYGCCLREQVRNEHQTIYDARKGQYRQITIKPIIYVGAINKNDSNTHRMDRTVGNLVYVPIKYNDPTGMIMTVYNITTDGDHTFLANNLAVHNCDAFADWCFYKAYGISTSKSLLGGGYDDYTVASAQMYQKKGALDTTPKTGDQVFFTKDGQVSGIYHTGIVTNVDDNYFYTVEGNTSSGKGVVANGGGVFDKKYLRLSYKGKALFGHPAYDKAISPYQSTAGKIPGKTPQYVAEVTATTLSVRSWAGTEYPQIKSWPLLNKGNWVDVCDFVYAKDNSLWAYIRIMSMFYGFVAAEYLKSVGG